MSDSIMVLPGSAGVPTALVPNHYLCDLLDYLEREHFEVRCRVRGNGVTVSFPSLKLGEVRRTLHNWERVLPSDVN